MSISTLRFDRLGENISEVLVAASKPDFKPHLLNYLQGALGRIAVAPIEKAEVIADSLQKQFEPNTDVENPRFSAHIQRKVPRFLDSPTWQHGFVTKYSTVTQILRVTELAHTGFQNHQATGMLFVDIVKAFDKIWHDGLISNMRLGFTDRILKIIH
ncbi:RNA-directed DNA polymerase from mobile element jockey [Trichonephila clavipes]|nr:RNA-directed DNA polymerase from mobile element jockey [Trichonephila clavipes]